jgi:hypothetical protein
MYSERDICAELFVQEWRTRLHGFLDIDGCR